MSLSPVTLAQAGLVEASRDRLIGLDFGPEQVDGAHGPKTRAALAAFQRARSLAPTGELDAGTASALAAYRSSARPRVAHTAGIERATPADLEELRAVAARLGTLPDWLAACISFETARTWDPAKRNASSGATGLIQFMPSTARNLGTTVADLARMTIREQLAYVERYFAPFKGRLASLADVYMAIFWPSAVGQGAGYVIAREGDLVAQYNPGLLAGGVISVGSAAAQPRAVLAAAGLRTVPAGASSTTPIVAGGAGLALVCLAFGALAFAPWGRS